MGIVNVTPDSFSDGGVYFDPRKAVERGLELVADGADIVDVGGESTRPGSRPVPAAEEIGRILPVIEGLRQQTQALLSVDTTKAAVAQAALDAGADIVNDTSAFRFDPAMPGVVARAGAGARPDAHAGDAAHDAERPPLRRPPRRDRRVPLRPHPRRRGRRHPPGAPHRRSRHRLRQDRRAQPRAPPPPGRPPGPRPPAPSRLLAQGLPRAPSSTCRPARGSRARSRRPSCRPSAAPTSSGSTTSGPSPGPSARPKRSWDRRRRRRRSRGRRRAREGRPCSLRPGPSSAT